MPDENHEYFKKEATVVELVEEMYLDRLKKNAKDWYIKEDEIDCFINDMGDGKVVVKCSIWKNGDADNEHMGSFAHKNGLEWSNYYHHLYEDLEDG